jgi:lipopolysaccharide transport system ATP-binding protein
MLIPAIKTTGLSKSYQLGVFGREALHEELTYWWHRIRGRDPAKYMSKVTDVKDRKLGPDDSQFDPDRPGCFWALRDATIEIQRGEVVGIIGRNGAGKSTLLKILSRITEPTQGEAIINGRIGSLLEVGTGFHPELTGRENIYLNGTILGMKRAEIDKKFQLIVDFSELGDFIDTPVKRYSSGMSVRLAFAVAAHLEPEILLVDEVLAVGDAAFQKKCLGKMADVAVQGRTILFVSHNIAAISRMCTRCLLVENGRITRDGPSGEVTAAYLAGTMETEGEKVWDNESAPGCDEISLISIRLRKSDGSISSVVSVADTLDLEVMYHVNKPGLRFRCCVFFNTQGICAFSSLEPLELSRDQIGRYVSIVRIPPHLLTEGEYIVGLTLFASYGMRKHYLTLLQAFLFHVFDPITGDTARGDYTQLLVGVLRPKMDWRTVYEPDLQVGGCIKSV